MKKKIAVLSGGYSNEAIVSQKSVLTILEHLNIDLFIPYHISIEKDGWYYLKDSIRYVVNQSDFTLEEGGNSVSFDFAYIMVHGTPGEDGLLQAYFDLLHIPYSTPDHFSSTLTFNKWACNSFLNSLGYHCAKSILIRKNDVIHPEAISDKLGFPLFIKPNDGGSSFGVTKVKTIEQIIPAISIALLHGNEVIIESQLTGTEITNGVYKSGNKVIVLPITEIISQNEFFDYEAKYEGKSEEITPARLTAEVTQRVKESTANIYTSLGLNGIVRIDYIVEDEVPFVIEINTVPGMSPQSIIPQQINAQGLDLQQVITEIILGQIDNHD